MWDKWVTLGRPCLLFWALFSRSEQPICQQQQLLQGTQLECPMPAWTVLELRLAQHSNLPGKAYGSAFHRKWNALWHGTEEELCVNRCSAWWENPYGVSLMWHKKAEFLASEECKMNCYLYYSFCSILLNHIFYYTISFGTILTKIQKVCCTVFFSFSHHLCPPHHQGRTTLKLITSCFFIIMGSEKVCQVIISQ